MTRQIFRFSFVGGVATLIHLMVGITLIHAGWRPVFANAGAFSVAFFISFAGHFGYTSSYENHLIPVSLIRFMAVALCGFAANEAILAGVLAQELLSPAMTLIVSTSLVACATFVLRRRWAFVTP